MYRSNPTWYVHCTVSPGFPSPDLLCLQPSHLQRATSFSDHSLEEVSGTAVQVDSDKGHLLCLPLFWVGGVWPEEHVSLLTHTENIPFLFKFTKVLCDRLAALHATHKTLLPFLLCLRDTSKSTHCTFAPGCFARAPAKASPPSLSLGDLSWTPLTGETFLQSNWKPCHCLLQTQLKATSLDSSKIPDLPAPIQSSALAFPCVRP